MSQKVVVKTHPDFEDAVEQINGTVVGEVETVAELQELWEAAAETDFFSYWVGDTSLHLEALDEVIPGVFDAALAREGLTREDLEEMAENMVTVEIDVCEVPTILLMEDVEEDPNA